MLEYQEYMKIFIGLLALLDPLAAVPVVVAVTRRDKPENLGRIIRGMFYPCC